MRLLLHVCLMGRVEGSVGRFVVRELVEEGGTLHVWMRCCMMQFILFVHVVIPEFKGSPSIMTVPMLGRAPLLIHVRSVGLVFGRERSGRGGVLCVR